jgi:hypothetical protein
MLSANWPAEGILDICRLDLRLPFAGFSGTIHTRESILDVEPTLAGEEGREWI